MDYVRVYVLRAPALLAALATDGVRLVQPQQCAENQNNAGRSFGGLPSSDDSSTLGEVTSCAGEESRRPAVALMTALGAEVDAPLHAIPKYPEPSPGPER